MGALFTPHWTGWPQLIGFVLAASALTLLATDDVSKVWRRWLAGLGILGLVIAFI